MLGDKIFSNHKQSADYVKQIVNMAEKFKKPQASLTLKTFYSTGEIKLDLITARQSVFTISEIQGLHY